MGRTTVAFGAWVTVAIGMLVALLLYEASTLPIRDVDLYWHLRAGRELLAGESVADIGAAWSYSPAVEPWVTTQWLSEVGLYLMHQAWSWPALVAYRTFTAAIAVAILVRTVLAGRPTQLAGLPFLIASAAVIVSSQERPSQATLIGSAVLGAVLLSGLRDARLPRWWLLLPATWLWANMHGGWVLVPGVLSLVMIGRLAEGGLRDNTVGRALLLVIAAVTVGTLTPAGLHSTLATLRFSGATEAIQEWNRTVPLEWPGILTVAMLVLVLVAWARMQVPTSEVTVTLLLLLFSWAAIRNIAPALLIVAPLTASRLVSAFPSISAHRQPRWPAAAAFALVVLALAFGLAGIAGRQPLPTEKWPIALASAIRELPGRQRVLNDYNVAGIVLHWADAEDQVGIDGRADRYGGDFIQRYLDLTNLRGDWRRTLDKLAPTAALLRSDSPLGHVLIAEFDWEEVAGEPGWVLLAPAEAEAIP